MNNVIGAVKKGVTDKQIAKNLQAMTPQNVNVRLSNPDTGVVWNENDFSDKMISWSNDQKIAVVISSIANADSLFSGQTQVLSFTWGSVSSDFVKKLGDWIDKNPVVVKSENYKTFSNQAEIAGTMMTQSASEVNWPDGYKAVSVGGANVIHENKADNKVIGYFAGTVDIKVMDNGVDVPNATFTVNFQTQVTNDLNQVAASFAEGKTPSLSLGHTQFAYFLKTVLGMVGMGDLVPVTADSNLSLLLAGLIAKLENISLDQAKVRYGKIDTDEFFQEISTKLGTSWMSDLLKHIPDVAPTPTGTTAQQSDDGFQGTQWHDFMMFMQTNIKKIDKDFQWGGFDDLEAAGNPPLSRDLGLFYKNNKSKAKVDAYVQLSSLRSFVDCMAPDVVHFKHFYQDHLNSNRSFFGMLIQYLFDPTTDYDGDNFTNFECKDFFSDYNAAQFVYHEVGISDQNASEVKSMLDSDKSFKNWSCSMFGNWDGPNTKHFGLKLLIWDNDATFPVILTPAFIDGIKIKEWFSKVFGTINGEAVNKNNVEADLSGSVLSSFCMMIDASQVWTPVLKKWCNNEMWNDVSYHDYKNFDENFVINFAISNPGKFQIQYHSKKDNTWQSDDATLSNLLDISKSDDVRVELQGLSFDLQNTVDDINKPSVYLSSNNLDVLFI